MNIEIQTAVEALQTEFHLEVKKVWEQPVEVSGDVRRYEIAVQFPQTAENIQSIFVNYYGSPDSKAHLGPCFYEEGTGEIKEIRFPDCAAHIKNLPEGTNAVYSPKSLQSLEEYSEPKLEDWEMNAQEIYQRYFQDGNLKPRTTSLFEDATESGNREFQERQAQKAEREKFGAEMFCRISGLTIARNPQLTYRAIETEINFRGFNYPARRKLLAEFKDKGTQNTKENTRFVLYVYLWHGPVEFKHAKSYPINQFWDSKLGQKILSVGTICRLAAVVEYFCRQDEKIQARFPTWRFVNDGRNNFENFFPMLNLWEGVIQEIENPTDRRVYVIKISMDNDMDVQKALKTGDEESVELAMLTEFARLSRKERPSIFDKRHPAHSKKIKPGSHVTTIGHILNVLCDFYQIPFEKQGAFRKFALSPQSQSLSFIQQTKERFAELGGLAEETPAYHGQFLAWLTRHIEIRRTVQQTIKKVREVNSPNIEMENKIADTLQARGKPNRENFLKEKDYLSALIAWKKSQQAPQFRIIKPTDNSIDM